MLIQRSTIQHGWPSQYKKNTYPEEPEYLLSGELLIPIENVFLNHKENQKTTNTQVLLEMKDKNPKMTGQSYEQNL